MSKLTLSADDATIQTAKKYARMHHTSVSSLFARYVKGLDDQSKSSGDIRQEVSTLRKLSGVISLSKDKSYDDMRRKAVKKKYEV